MDKMFEQRKRVSEERVETFKKEMDEIVRSEKDKGIERLNKLKTDLDEDLKQFSAESDARVAENKRATAKQATENYENAVAGINPDLPPNIQKKLRESYGVLLTKTIESILSTDYDLKGAMKKYFPDPPKI